MKNALHFCFCFYLGLSFLKADILPIQSFKTPLGLETWLVEDHTSPVVSLVFNFDKAKLGSPFKPSTTLFNRIILDGAGVLSPLEMDRFTKGTPAMATLQTTIAKTTLTLKTTKNGLASTLKLWSQLISNPRLQNANLAHGKAQALSAISHSNEDLELSAFLNLLQTIFPKSSFKPDFEKAPEIINSLTASDLEKETTDQFLSSRPKVVVVGDVSKRELTEILDATFGALPLQSPAKPVKSLEPRWNRKDVFIEKNLSQSVVVFGQPGVDPLSKEYSKYLLLEYVLYGRLFDELREKRGLVYSIQFSETHIKDIDLLIGNFSCECTNAPQVAKFIKSEWERLKDFGITQKELSHAQLSFKRNKILSLTSTTSVAKEYANPLAFNLTPEAARTHLINADKVTLKEMNKFIQDVLKPETLTFVLIGPHSSPSNLKGKK
ncbi:MAG TPA: pitrilysin family protein [Alphaproteobacteria bacterium]|nr:pitrilysin family protein [Alphaproteobacteria bacterium]